MGVTRREKYQGQRDVGAKERGKEPPVEKGKAKARKCQRNVRKQNVSCAAHSVSSLLCLASAPSVVRMPRFALASLFSPASSGMCFGSFWSCFFSLLSCCSYCWTCCCLSLPVRCVVAASASAAVGFLTLIFSAVVLSTTGISFSFSSSLFSLCSSSSSALTPTVYTHVTD